MSSYIKFTENDMRLAKQVDLIQYMLAEHPDRVIYRTGTLRDCNHDSLVIYHDSYFRYSLHEAGDSISYLTKYQGYGWVDAVSSLLEFSLGHDVTHKYKKPAAPLKPYIHTFRVPPDTGDISALQNYISNECNISNRIFRNLIYMKKLYATAIPGEGRHYACFANPEQNYYLLQNTKQSGAQKIIYTENPLGSWWFSSDTFLSINHVFSMMETNIETYEDDYPLFICESPLDAISLYELTKEPGIYIALSSLDPKNLDYAIHSFPTENLIPRPVILSLSKTPAADPFCSNLPYQRILPMGNSWSEDLRKIHRSPMSMREVDDDDTSFVCALLDSKGNVTSYSTYQDSKNVKLIDIKIPTYG